MVAGDIWEVAVASVTPEQRREGLLFTQTKRRPASCRAFTQARPLQGVACAVTTALTTLSGKCLLNR